jgi:RNA polymerase sigma-70 factor (ECF subfamily)
MVVEKNEWDRISFLDKEEILKEKTGKDFSYYYDKFYPKLLYFTQKICGDQQKAEDISIDSFLMAIRKIDQYEQDKSQFSTWLFTIAKNLTLQEVKLSQRKISMDHNIDEEGTTMKDFIQDLDVQDVDDPVDDIIKEKHRIMMNKINSLKSPYREVIIMREIDNMSYKDISDILDINLSTLKSRIKNGRELLMNMVEREYSLIDSMYPETFYVKRRRNHSEDSINDEFRNKNSSGLKYYEFD